MFIYGKIYWVKLLLQPISCPDTSPYSGIELFTLTKLAINFHIYLFNNIETQHICCAV